MHRRRPDRLGFLKAASLAGVGAVAGAEHGKFSLSLNLAGQRSYPAELSQAEMVALEMGCRRPKAGASNHITPQKVLDAAKWIKDGKIYKLGRNYELSMPLFGKRSFRPPRIPGSPTGGPFGENRLVYHDEYVATEIGQVGTQFDGLGHIGIVLGDPGDKSEIRFYNGHAAADFSDAYGLKKLGMENCKPFFTRGHLVNMVGLKGA